MGNITIEFEELKKIYDYVTESIIISDEDNNIVMMNRYALSKFKIEEDAAILKKLEEFIPLDEREIILKTIKNTDNSYYDVMLKKTNSKLFPAYVSGQVLQYRNKNYGIARDPILKIFTYGPHNLFVNSAPDIFEPAQIHSV